MTGSGASDLPHWHTPDDGVIEIASGEGARVYDAAGAEYLDFVSQLYCVNAGHGNEAIAGAMHDQLQRIPYVSSAMRSTVRTELADRLVEVAPGRLTDVFFAISGSEANEAAVQFAREYQDANKVLTRWRSYHGGTYGAASLSGDPATRAPVERHAATTGAAKFLPPVQHRSPFDADSPGDLAERAADHLEYVIRNEGPDSVAAVLTEPVGGTSGAYPPPPGYFERVREICDEYDVLLISDEVITGFGRCGDWFGIQTEDVRPDMITFAKGVTSAYAPLAGVMVADDIGEHFRAEGVPVGQTFAGHPVSCAAGVAALDEYADGLVEQVRGLAPALEAELRRLESYDVVGDVRGRGFLWAVEFTDPETGEPFVHPWEEDDENPVAEARRVAKEEHGVIFGSGRPDVQTIVAPPFCIDEGDIEEAVDALAAGIEDAFE